jgi:hypothetical protein
VMDCWGAMRMGEGTRREKQERLQSRGAKARTAREQERERKGWQTLSAKVKNRLSSPYWIYRSTGRALRSAHPAPINCRWKFLSLTSGTHHDRGGRTSARAPSLRRGNRRTAAGGHVRLPTPPTTRAAAAPEKARPQHLVTATTAGIKWPGPLLSKEDPRAARAPGSYKSDPRRVQLPTGGLETCSK